MGNTKGRRWLALNLNPATSTPSLWNDTASPGRGTACINGNGGPAPKTHDAAPAIKHAKTIAATVCLIPTPPLPLRIALARGFNLADSPSQLRNEIHMRCFKERGHRV